MNAWHIKLAARRMHQGGVVAYPTEAVFGIGCDPDDRAAVRRVLAIKNRPTGAGLILVAATIDQLQPFLESVDPAMVGQLSDSWPGPVTWVVPAAARSVPWLGAADGSLAVRVTAHRPCARLCEAFGGAIVSTSANRRHCRPARSAQETRLRLSRFGIDYVLSGRTGGARAPSEIRHASTGAVLRPSSG